MKKLLTFAATIAAAGLVSASASAAVISFSNEADTNGERGLDNNGGAGAAITIDGVNLVLTAGMDSAWHPYLDEGVAGLGVCKVLTQNDQCDPGDDDNVTVDEQITVAFADGAADVSGFIFRDADHVDITNSALMIDFAIDGGAFSTVSFAALAGMVFEGISSITFRYNEEQFYIDSLVAEIPIPAALPLLISGLAGLGFASRKRKTA